MSPIEDLSQYPPYCQKGGPDTKSHPIIRARKLFAEGIKMPLDKRCTNCIMLGQDCIRCDTKFSKCCWCTAEDMHPTGMCHLPGAPEPSNLSMTALAKKRKL